VRNVTATLEDGLREVHPCDHHMITWFHRSSQVAFDVNSYCPVKFTGFKCFVGLRRELSSMSGLVSAILPGCSAGGNFIRHFLEFNLLEFDELRATHLQGGLTLGIYVLVAFVDGREHRPQNFLEHLDTRVDVQVCGH
jgi:hypothetical protein